MKLVFSLVAIHHFHHSDTEDTALSVHSSRKRHVTHNRHRWALPDSVRMDDVGNILAQHNHSKRAQH
uniref:Putative secreted protein n=1 Tax=Anopheles darlingi TaxID=43151 RepID=A0A2M4DMY7_ANODA